MKLLSSVAMFIAAVLLAASIPNVHAHDSPAATDPESRFGAREMITSAELSPDGEHIAYVGSASGSTDHVGIINIDEGAVLKIAGASGKRLQTSSCGWAENDRVVCRRTGTLRRDNQIGSFSHVYAMDIDGKKLRTIAPGILDNQDYPRSDFYYGEYNNERAGILYKGHVDGEILDWLDGSDSKVLMSRHHVPEARTGRVIRQSSRGMGVDLVDTRSLKIKRLEPPRRLATYISDGHGVIRLMSAPATARDQSLTHFYRLLDDRKWLELGANIVPVAVDSHADVAYVLQNHEGRQALYRISLDGSLESELVFAHPEADIDGVVSVGPAGRVIGASYSTDRPEIEYFEPTYVSLTKALERAIPGSSSIAIVSASADEQRVLLCASGDADPGTYYLMDRNKGQLSVVMSTRPHLAETELAEVRTVTFPAKDGTVLSGQLMLPPGVDDEANLPAIVMPHGGSAARDVFGFNWLAQYFVHRGFAVLQPNYRGPDGFGENWFLENGFQNWAVAVGDVIDGARWLIAEGIADADQLATIGWSHGGYAALQVNAVDPDLFKAVIAIAPVTDFEMLKQEYASTFKEGLVRDFVGSGSHIVDGSPLQNVDKFKAPVMLFHGEFDANVSVDESRALDSALSAAYKKSSLTVYPELGHELNADDVRADMLHKSYDFLRTNLRL